MKNVIKGEAKEAKRIFGKIKRRDLGGEGGQAIKNSSYQLAQNLTMKIGSLLFTVIIARMLMPERMGLYSLTLATIILFMAFSDLGISSAFAIFGSKMLGEGRLGKARGYKEKLLKWKVRLILTSSLILLISAYFISNYYYQKPIFYALLAGVLYLAVVAILEFMEQLFKAANNFRIPLIKEIIFQIIRVILVPVVILLLLRSDSSNEVTISLIFLAVALSYFFAALFLSISSKKKLKFLKVPAKNLNKSEIKSLKKFIFPLSAMALSGVFFGYIDILMLGHYVSSKFIAYYGAAFALVGSATAIIGFTAAALTPVFSRLKGDALEKMFKKTKTFTVTISVMAGIITYFVSRLIVLLIYGKDYLPAGPILKIFSILVVILPTIAIYNAYFISQKKTMTVATLLIGSTVLNIIFNFIGISYGLINYGEMGGVFGAVIATIVSRGLYLTGLILWRKRDR